MQRVQERVARVAGLKRREVKTLRAEWLGGTAPPFESLELLSLALAWRACFPAGGIPGNAQHQALWTGSRTGIEGSRAF